MKAKSSICSTNYWQRIANKEKFTATCLLYNYDVFSVEVKKTTSFGELKAIAFDHVSKNHKTRENNFDKYQILYVSEDAFYQEAHDDSVLLEQVDLFVPVFRFFNPQDRSISGSNVTQFLSRFNVNLSSISAMHRDIHEQRVKLNNLTFNEHEKKKELSPNEKFLIKLPQNIRKVDSLSTKHQTMIVNRKTQRISFYYQPPDKELINFEIEVPMVITVSQLKTTIIKKLNTYYPIEKENEHTLKLAGTQIYLTGILNISDHTFDESIRFVDYVGIQEKITNEDEIILTIVHQSEYLIEQVDVITKMDSIEDDQSTKVERVNIWNLESTEKLAIKIINLDSKSQVCYMLKLGLFYGNTPLEKIIETKAFVSATELEDIIFDIPINRLPVNAKICMMLYQGKHKSETKIKNMEPAAWLNVNVFDYKGYLGENTQSYYMYTHEATKSLFGLNPLGTTIPNPSQESNYKLSIKFVLNGKAIFYPSERQMKNTLARYDTKKLYKQKECFNEAYFSEMSEWLTFNELTVDQHTELWKYRYTCATKFPNLIPKILQSIPDYSKGSVCAAHVILKKAPLLNPELSLELFMLRYCHPLIRSYLVKNLEQFSDEMLILYMTQIIEGLKVEQHIYNELTVFLMKRALNNQRFAHFLIWHLLADSHEPEVSVRNALIIEAYCRVNPTHFDDILRQADMVTKLKHFYELASVNNVTDKNSMLELFKKYVSFQAVSNVFSDLSCPLDPTFHLKMLVLDECKIMESKKKPLLLVFKTDEEYAPKVRILYKYGDDLRQDILVLKSMQIIDNFCQNIDPEIKFTCYNVLNTGFMEGMIQLVENASTLGNIQAKRGFKPQTLYEWYIDKLKDENRLNDDEIKLGCQRFAATCAGYSVITYILGIGDRHNDNIMIHKSGRLFHIDFGHILGNFKSFYGIKRERAPFIMTKDFLYFATSGKNSKYDKKQYRDYCADLFVKIREYSYLIVLPFLLMVNAGLPELQTESDIYYITNAIDFSLDVAEAKKKFEEKFSEAVDKSWSTELNFMAHNMRIAGSAKNKGQAANISDDIFTEQQ